jgi:hypothetical protein
MDSLINYKLDSESSTKRWDTCHLEQINRYSELDLGFNLIIVQSIQLQQIEVKHEKKN